MSTNGYFSFNERPHYATLPEFPLKNNEWIVAPFAADIDTSEHGSVQYTLNEGFSYSNYRSVSEFIGEQTGNKKFYGTSMIVAEWNEVPKFDASVSNT